jgi:hypothetical protein
VSRCIRFSGFQESDRRVLQTRQFVSGRIAPASSMDRSPGHHQ